MAERKKSPVIQARNEEIRAKYAEGARQVDLAAEYLLSPGRISAICKGITKGKAPPPSVEEAAKIPPREREEVEDNGRLSGLISSIEELIDRTRGMVDLYESEGFYENKLISTIKNYRFSRMGGCGSGVVMIIQVPDMKKAREAARKGFVRFLPEK